MEQDKHSPDYFLDKYVGKPTISGLKWKSLLERKHLLIEAMRAYSDQENATLLEATRELREALNGCQDLLKQTTIHRKANGLSGGDVFLSSQIHQNEELLSKYKYL